MRTTKFLFIVYILTLGLSLSGCRRDSGEVWEDSRSAGRHMGRGLRTMGGKHGDSRAVQYREDFMPADQGYSADPAYANAGSPSMGEFVPLSDQPNDSQVAMADFVSQQPRETPGDPGSSIPGISAFQDPSVNAAWAAVFRNITFDYNSNLVKGQSNLDTLHAVANYMRSNPNVYVFVAGHTDERGPDAYNLALGSRRSNAVRNQLIAEGVNSDNLFTISYGKEQPLIVGHDDESWGQNRRVEFKIYQR